jgi:uncharacterized protein YukE
MLNIKVVPHDFEKAESDLKAVKESLTSCMERLLNCYDDAQGRWEGAASKAFASHSEDVSRQHDQLMERLDGLIRDIKLARLTLHGVDVMLAANNLG